ncbi:MAG TPA: MBL fold metallo-hydrolase, partial [bacterium]|nr:MBL fold metallo-hydrolase [bacterium]
MDKVSQTLFAAEYDRFVRGDGHALDRLDGEMMELFKQHYTRLDVPAVQRRVRALKELPRHPPLDSQYLARFGVRGVVRYPLLNGHVIYKIPVFSFAMNSWKDHWTSTYLVITPNASILVDTGTHLSEQSMREGLDVVREFYKEPLRLEQVDQVLITHAHFDHFGGLNFVLPASHAQLYVHEWDAGTLAHYPDEVTRGRQRILSFLRQSGMPAEEIETFMQMHGEPKRRVAGFPVHRAFGDGERILADFEVIHTPGHCPGLCCIRVG